MTGSLVPWWKTGLPNSAGKRTKRGKNDLNDEYFGKLLELAKSNCKIVGSGHRETMRGTMCAGESAEKGA